MSGCAIGCDSFVSDGVRLSIAYDGKVGVGVLIFFGWCKCFEFADLGVLVVLYFF